MGNLIKPKDMIYYMINISLHEDQANSVSIDLTPIKGKFMMVATRGGKLPSLSNFDVKSTDNHLSL